jgi:hypothetical protein
MSWASLAPFRSFEALPNPRPLEEEQVCLDCDRRRPQLKRDRLGSSMTSS